jgi:hypothetical protein
MSKLQHKPWLGQIQGWRCSTPTLSYNVTQFLSVQRVKARVFGSPSLYPVVVAVTLTLATMTGYPACASTVPQPNSQPPLAILEAVPGSTTGIDALENKFFEHTYSSEILSRRLERIEKMVFGESKTGSDNERLAQLLSIVPTKKHSDGPGKDANATAGNATAMRPASRTAVQNVSDYPSVTALESQILGNAYRQEPIRTRLDRLETKAFGEISGGSDLSLRVSQLQHFALEHNLAPRDASMPVAKYVPPPDASATLTEKVTWLEEQVYGKAVADPSIFNRIRRLNRTVLPTDYLEFDGSIPQNVNTLISAVELDQADRLTDQVDGSNPGRRRYRPLPATLPDGFATTASKPKLNSTATRLQDFGMPSPMKDIGVTPDQLATTAPGDDDDDNSKKKKKKKGGFFAMIKEAAQEGSNDVFGIPRYAYGDDPYSR